MKTETETRQKEFTLEKGTCTRPTDRKSVVPTAARPTNQKEEDPNRR